MKRIFIRKCTHNIENTFYLETNKLTVDADEYPLADGRRHAVRGDAEVHAHVQPANLL